MEHHASPETHGRIACRAPRRNADERARQAAAGLGLVRENYSWESVVARFEEILGIMLAPRERGSAVEHVPHQGAISPLPVT